MPNQPDPNQNQSNNPPTGAAPPIISSTMDLPPLPPDLSDQLSAPPIGAAPPSPEQTTPNPSSPVDNKPSPPQSPSVVGTKPKKKFGAGRIIATILGVFVLVGGIGAGIVTIQDPLFFQDLAAGKKTWRDIGNPRAGRHAGKLEFERAQRAAAENPPPANAGNSGPPQNYIPAGVDPNAPPPSGLYPVYEGGASSGQVVGYRFIEAPGVFAGAVQSDNSIYKDILINTYHMSEDDYDYARDHINDGLTWVPGGVGCGDTTNDNIDCNYWHWTACIEGGIQGVGCGVGVVPEDGENENPPDTPSITASCAGVKTVDNSGNELSQAQLSVMKTGDTFNICVGGTSSSGGFDRAQFSINDSVQPETTTAIAGVDGFCSAYQIPDGATNINIKAKIHHIELDQWFGETF